MALFSTRRICIGLMRKRYQSINVDVDREKGQLMIMVCLPEWNSFVCLSSII